MYYSSCVEGRFILYCNQNSNKVTQYVMLVILHVFVCTCVVRLGNVDLLLLLACKDA